MCFRRHVLFQCRRNCSRCIRMRCIYNCSAYLEYNSKREEQRNSTAVSSLWKQFAISWSSCESNSICLTFVRLRFAVVFSNRHTVTTRERGRNAFLYCKHKGSRGGIFNYRKVWTATSSPTNTPNESTLLLSDSIICFVCFCYERTQHSIFVLRETLLLSGHKREFTFNRHYTGLRYFARPYASDRHFFCENIGDRNWSNFIILWRNLYLKLKQTMTFLNVYLMIFFHTVRFKTFS